MPHEPKKKHSKSRKRTRRASINLEALSLVACTNCKSLTPQHMVCKSCGFYKGISIGQKTTAKVTKA